MERANRGFDKPNAVIQHCSMTAIPVSKRGTVTLPPDVRRKLGLESVPHPMLLVELREDGVFLHPAAAVPVRDIPLQQIQKWIKDDEKGAAKFWKKEKSSR
jgi:bifunctional DNA-binding transcriptional regulator/antitoxin component of YhaV-PrlF toxin-antitoxin module